MLRSVADRLPWSWLTVRDGIEMELVKVQRHPQWHERGPNGQIFAHDTQLAPPKCRKIKIDLRQGESYGGIKAGFYDLLMGEKNKQCIYGPFEWYYAA